MGVCLCLQDLTVTCGTHFGTNILKRHNSPALKHWLFILWNCHHNDLLWLLPVIKTALATSLVVMTEQKQYWQTIGKTRGSIFHASCGQQHSCSTVVKAKGLTDILMFLTDVYLVDL